MNDKQIKAFLRAGLVERKAIGAGLYIRSRGTGIGYWEIRYSINGKRRTMTIDGGTYPQMSLADAKMTAAILIHKAKQGIDPLAERERNNEEEIVTVDDLYADWYLHVASKRKHPEIPERQYTKDIKPTIGRIKVKDVNARDIRAIISKVAASDRATVSNKVLFCCKQLFNHACKLDLIPANPASAFKVSDAGGTETSRTRRLTFTELKATLKVLRDNDHSFNRDNYLAISLLVCLGVRKGELIAAKWEEFDFDKQLWHLPANRTKTKVAITIPLSNHIIPWFKELYVKANGSEFLLPSRRINKPDKNKPKSHISNDTLNHALAKMFGQKVDSKKKPSENFLGLAGIEHFVIHDLRRTCRSLLAEIGVSNDVAERCLNHKRGRIEDIYDHYDYLKERTEALEKLASMVAPMVNDENNITPFTKRA
ncbi:MULTISPECIES: tyrosine-type recombinase/integrase [unclassified Shewanella]|uniref:tyrosine-type recombinase/integrase n=1 Tax=unclassified Shewanella TaxID=196818 RepID=UPI0035532A9F